MAKKKNPWEHLPADEIKKVATVATKKTTTAPDDASAAKRKMVRISPEVHRMAKKAAVLSGVGLQEYMENLIRADVAARFPEAAT